MQAREDFGGGFAEDDRPATVYPPPHRLSPSVPAGLRREWEEAQTCFASKAYAACVVMVRRTLEGTCAEQGVQVTNLDKALKRLATDGLIDQTLAEWADVLRRVGNKGAHYTGAAVSREDAQDALDFAEALLDHLTSCASASRSFRLATASSIVRGAASATLYATRVADCHLARVERWLWTPTRRAESS